MATLVKIGDIVYAEDKTQVFLHVVEEDDGPYFHASIAKNFQLAHAQAGMLGKVLKTTPLSQVMGLLEEKAIKESPELAERWRYYD